jgi:2-oxoglutarate/2-oxoacid ferredoxin oxidoreductase subunit beta
MSVDKYLDPATKPFPFCPGCSHSQVLDTLAASLALLDLPINRVAIVTDIGCIGISDRHFKTHTFHGLHGRSITYATGLKLANPELTVVVLVGDGGLGIGGHHFLHAARRNVDLTVLVCNNFNFGMTGGQHSVTTPHDGITATTSQGNIEYPLDVTGLVDVAQGNFAARLLFHDKALPDVIARAITTPGFAAVEIWEMCTAYFAPRNKVSRRALDGMLTEHGLKTGILFSRERPGYSEQMQAGVARLEGTGSTQGQLLAPEFPQPISQRRTLLIAGRAGQKVRSSAILLGRAGALSDLHVTQRDDYPVTVMTGHSIAEMIFQPDPINALGVEVPDIVILTAPEGLARNTARLAALPETTTVYTIPELLPLSTPARVVEIPTEALGLKRQRTQLVLGCAAYVALKTGLLTIDALLAAARKEGREEISSANVKTLEAIREKVLEE